jgi:membrane protein YdbS with pleckstrin-like domain
MPAPTLDPQPEIVTVTPTFKAYGEFYAVAFVLLIYDGPVLFCLILATIAWHRYRFRYHIKADSIVFERGLVMRTSDALPVMKIKEIIVKQGPIQKHLNIGSLRILHSDPTLPNMSIKGIPYPNDLKAVIGRNVRRLREVRAVRKADISGQVGEHESD